KGAGTKSGSSEAARSGGKSRDFLPSRDDILRYISENPDKSGKRDIAKAFSLKGEGRIWLKDTLAELQSEGLLEKDRKRLMRPGSLPAVAVLDIFARDEDGLLLARPTEQREGALPTVVPIKVPRSGPAPG